MTMTFKGRVIYHYDFTNDKGQDIKTGKALFNIDGLCVYICNRSFLNHKIGSIVICDLKYDGKEWVLDKTEDVKKGE